MVMTMRLVDGSLALQEAEYPLDQPAGPSEIPEGTLGWNNMGLGIEHALCQICGTWEGETPTVSMVLGLQVVEPCCGALLDALYRDLGKEFAIQYLKDFAKDPTASEYYELRRCLQDSLSEASERVAETSGQIEDCQAHLATVTGDPDPQE